MSTEFLSYWPFHEKNLIWVYISLISNEAILLNCIAPDFFTFLLQDAFVFFLRFILFIYLKEKKEMRKDRKRLAMHRPTSHTAAIPRCVPSQWQESPSWVARDLVLPPPPSAFSGTLAGSWMKSGVAGTQTASSSSTHRAKICDPFSTSLLAILKLMISSDK